MFAGQNLSEFSRQAGTPLGIYGCLDDSPEHGTLFGTFSHNIPLFSTVRVLIPRVNSAVKIKYEFCGAF